jgi:PilZ domain-containing protein
MPLTIPPCRRFPVQCSDTYNAGPFQAQDTIWNLSRNGWKYSGDLPLRVRKTCPLSVNLPSQESVLATAAIVRWVRGREHGLATLVVDEQTGSRLEHLITGLVQESGESIP